MEEKLKAYVAGRISRQDEVRSIIARLEEVGVEIARDWTWTGDIKNEAEAVLYRQRAYATKKECYAKEAVDDIQASIDADIFVILSDPQGSSMYVELGAALASLCLTGKPSRIYAIGPHFDRMLHYQHPSVTWSDDIEDVIEDIKKYQR